MPFTLRNLKEYLEDIGSVFGVVGGSGRMKVDDQVVEIKQWDAVRVPPGMWRGYEAGADGLEMLVIGAPSLGEAPREDVEGGRDWCLTSTPGFPAFHAPLHLPPGTRSPRVAGSEA